MDRPLTRRDDSRSRAHKEKSNTRFKEKLLLQCIICSIILAAVLLVNLIDSELCAQISASVKTALSQDFIPEDTVPNIIETVKSVLGLERMWTKEGDGVVYERIDEDILKQLNAYEDFYDIANH